MTPAERQKCNEQYAEDIAARHSGWLTWHMMRKREAAQEEHDRLVAEYKVKLRDVFDFYDKDGSGYIDRSELKGMLMDGPSHSHSATMANAVSLSHIASQWPTPQARLKSISRHCGQHRGSVSLS